MQSRSLAQPLEALGAHVLAFPVIATVDPEDWGPADRAIGQLASYDWVVLTSANAVRAFLARLASAGVGAAALNSVQVAVVGSATATVLAEAGIVPDLVPEDFRAEGLLDSFESLGVGEGSRVLIPRALEAREVLPDTLRLRGVHVDVVPVYRTVLGDVEPGVIERLGAGSVDAVTFTSPSTFRNFRTLVDGSGLDADEALRGLVIASIGPVTSQAVREAGHVVAVEPEESTAAALASALAEHLGD
jgi:uroporphyrinogen III methyltransferase/synthase